MYNGFSESARGGLNAALEIAGKLGHPYVGTEHLLLAILSDEDSDACRLLNENGVTFDAVREELVRSAGSSAPVRVSVNDMTPRFRKVVAFSAQVASQTGSGEITPAHLLFALLGEEDSVAVDLLRRTGADVEKIRSDLIEETGAPRDAEDEEEEAPSGRPSSSKQGKKGMRALQKYGRDLTALAREGKIDPVIGREEETQRVIQILSRRTKNNPCLIGEPGVGKTAVVEGLAQRIADGSVPETLLGKTLITLDLSGMLAGAKYRGEFEERLKEVMGEVVKNKNVILFIDEIHTLIGTGAAEGSIDAANILKPALSRGEMQLIGATTIAEYRKHIEKDAALERRFQPVMVGEPTEEDTLAILKGLRPKYEAHHKMTISDEALESAVSLSKRYIADRFLPDKAIDLVDEAASRKRIHAMTLPPEIKEIEKKLSSLTLEKEEAAKAQSFEKAAQLRDEEKKVREQLETAKKEWQSAHASQKLTVERDDIEQIVTQQTGIPVKKLAEEEGERMLRLEELLKERVVGQDEAVSAVARAIRRGRTGLKDPKRPVGSFIFLGPTGVGKTELTKALADILFGDENAMIRIDMSEYMEKHSVSKLIGSPPGYVGYEEGGQLTEKVRRKPYSVVLFDEIEKAHPDVFNILLQVLDDGVLTDSQGRKVDFKNTVIIMTSNIGAQSFSENRHALGFASSDDAPDVKSGIESKDMGYLRDTFRPEFINRIDEIVIFNRLTQTDIEKIAGILLNDVGKRIASAGIGVSFDPSLVKMVAKEGFDPVYGARPLRRVIQRKVEDGLSTEMLEGRVKAGDRVTISANEKGELVFSPSGKS